MRVWLLEKEEGMKYQVEAKQYGNKVIFSLEATNGIKDALEMAKEKANEIFEYQGLGETPTVTVKEIKRGF